MEKYVSVQVGCLRFLDSYRFLSTKEPLILTKEDFWSTLKQTTPPDEEINRTQEIIKKCNVKNGQDLTMLNLKKVVLQLADVFENFVEKATLEYKIKSILCTPVLYLVIHGKLV